MIDIELSVVINRTIEETFQFVVNHGENSPLWVAGLAEVKGLPEGPVDVGAQWTDVGSFFGVRGETSYELTEYTENSSIGYKTISGPSTFTGKYIFEPVDGGTKVSLTMKGETGGLFKLAEPIVARMFRRQWDTNLANLKDLLETHT